MIHKGILSGLDVLAELVFTFSLERDRV